MTQFKDLRPGDFFRYYKKPYYKFDNKQAALLEMFAFPENAPVEKFGVTIGKNGKLEFDAENEDLP